MKIEEFDEETTKLENFYEKEIPGEQRKFWFEEFKKINIKRYKYIIGMAYRKFKFLPKLADMIEINKNCGYVEENQPLIQNCKICKGTGLIFYQKKVNDVIYDYVCRCNCANGLKHSKEIPNVQQVGQII